MYTIIVFEKGGTFVSHAMKRTAEELESFLAMWSDRRGVGLPPDAMNARRIETLVYLLGMDKVELQAMSRDKVREIYQDQFYEKQDWGMAKLMGYVDDIWKPIERQLTTDSFISLIQASPSFRDWVRFNRAWKIRIDRVTNNQLVLDDNTNPYWELRAWELTYAFTNTIATVAKGEWVPPSDDPDPDVTNRLPLLYDIWPHLIIHFVPPLAEQRQTTPSPSWLGKPASLFLEYHPQRTTLSRRTAVADGFKYDSTLAVAWPPSQNRRTHDLLDSLKQESSLADVQVVGPWFVPNRYIQSPDLQPNAYLVIREFLEANDNIYEARRSATIENDPDGSFGLMSKMMSDRLTYEKDILMKIVKRLMGLGYVVDVSRTVSEPQEVYISERLPRATSTNCVVSKSHYIRHEANATHHHHH